VTVLEATADARIFRADTGASDQLGAAVRAVMAVAADAADDHGSGDGVGTGSQSETDCGKGQSGLRLRCLSCLSIDPGCTDRGVDLGPEGGDGRDEEAGGAIAGIARDTSLGIDDEDPGDCTSEEYSRFDPLTVVSLSTAWHQPAQEPGQEG